MTVLEGYRLILDTLTNANTRTLYRNVLVTREALEHPIWGNKLSMALETLWREKKEQQQQQQDGIMRQDQSSETHTFPFFRIQLVTEQVLKATCDTVTPQGIMAILDIPPSYNPQQNRMSHDASSTTMQPNDGDDDAAAAAKTAKLFLVLDGISDPGNVGTLLRSSKAVGVECVVLLPGSCDVWNPKAVRSAMGTTFEVPVYYAESWEGCLDALEEWGVYPRGERVYAATMWMEAGRDEEKDDDEGLGDGASGGMRGLSSKAHFEVDWCGTGAGSNGGGAAAALVLGKEGPGLSLQVRESVAKGEIRSVYVPMEVGIESLNVGTCGSVIMFEYHRQKLCSSSAGGARLVSTIDGDVSDKV